MVLPFLESIVHTCTKVGPEAGLKAVRGVLKRGFHYAIDLSPGSYRTKFGTRTLSNGFKTSKKPPFLAIFYSRHWEVTATFQWISAICRKFLMRFSLRTGHFLRAIRSTKFYRQYTCHIVSTDVLSSVQTSYRQYTCL